MILDDLHDVIAARRRTPPPGSYVASLFAGGNDRVARKIGEEAVEVILASKAEAGREVVREVADLWFHCMVLLELHGASHRDVLSELEERFRGGAGSRG